MPISKNNAKLQEGNLAVLSVDANVIEVATLPSNIKSEPLKKKFSLHKKETKKLDKSSSVKNETIMEISLEELYPPEFHPFHVNDDEAMRRLADNVKLYGIREPGVARPRKDVDGRVLGGYELLIGNRRKRACELLELPTMPIIIRELSNEDAIIASVDSNLEQRERILPSEKAWAYKIKMEALNHKGIKGDKLSAETVAERYDDTRSQVFRVIRLTKLVIGLLDKVDNNKLALNPAVELSVLSQREQTQVVCIMEQNDVKPSLSQAVRLRKLKKEGKLTKELIYEVLSETKSSVIVKDNDILRYRKYFPADYTASQIDNIIFGLLEDYQIKLTTKSNDELSTQDDTSTTIESISNKTGVPE